MKSTTCKRWFLAAAALAATLALAGASPIQAAEIEVYWGLAGSGNWGNALNWNPTVVPHNNGGNTYFAILDHLSAVTVTVDGSYTVDSLFVGADDQVTIDNARSLYVDTAGGHGIIDNRGTIVINSSTSYTYLFPKSGPVVLKGGGVLAGEGNQLNRIQASSGGSLVNQDNTIRGALSLGANTMGITNAGLIVADNPTYPLTIDPNVDGVTNTGTLRAESGATMILAAGDYTNTGGVIEALDGSVVQLNSSVIVTGGTLQTAGSGAFRSNGSPRLIDLASQGLVEIPNSRVLSLEGSIVNSGTIEITSVSSYTYLQPANGPVTLSGGGVIAGEGNQLNRIQAASGGSLVNQDNTIRGTLSLGANTMGITNAALIVADNPTYPLTIDPNVDGVTNTGTLRAESGATMILAAGDYTNTGGVIEALDGSVVQLNSSAIVTGGTLQTVGSGVFISNGNPRLIDLANQGTLEIPNSRTLYLEGAIANSDTIEITNSTSYTYLLVAGGPVTLSGGGVITGEGNQLNRIQPASGGSLVNQDNTIRGAMNIGVNAMGISNAGTMLADHATYPLTIDPNGDGFLNTGLLHVTGAGGMTINAGPMDQQGAVDIEPTCTLNDEDDFIQTAGLTTVDGTLDMGTSDIVDLRGGVLGGTGQVLGDVVNSGGSVSPGGSAGTLTIGGDYTQERGASIRVELGGLIPDAEHDVLNVTGDAVLDGEFQVAIIGGFAPAPDDSFIVMNAASVSGHIHLVTPIDFPGDLWPDVELRGTDVIIRLVGLSGMEEPGDETAEPAHEPFSVFPNPSSSGRVSITLGLTDKSSDSVSLEIYDMAGRRIRTLLNESLGSAPRSVAWDGRNAFGERVAAGVYFLRLSNRSGHEEVKRITVLR